jgi:hypothetical protein
MELRGSSPRKNYTDRLLRVKGATLVARKLGKKIEPQFENSEDEGENPVAWVRERTMPTERPPLVGEDSTNFRG